MARSKTGHASDNGQTPIAGPDEPIDIDSAFDQAGDVLQHQNAPAPSNGPDPFDPASLRLTGDLNVEVSVKKAVLTVPCRKPNRGDFVRVHPSPTYRLTTYVLELKEEASEVYLVAPQLASQLVGIETAVSPRTLVTAVNRAGVVFLWPLRPVVPDGRRDEWARSALEVAEIATRSWVRIEANMSLGAYDCRIACGQLPEPEWPELSLRDLLAVAFRDRFIKDQDHPVLKKLRGEV